MIFFFLFLQLHLWHMEIPEPSLATAPALPTLRCICSDPTAWSNPGSSPHWARPRIELHPHGHYIRFLTHWTKVGAPGEMFIQILYPFLNWVVFLLLSYKGPLYSLDTSLLSDIWFATIFSHSLSYFFHFFNVCFGHKMFTFWWCPICLFCLLLLILFIFTFVCVCICV